MAEKHSYSFGIENFNCKYQLMVKRIIMAKKHNYSFEIENVNCKYQLMLLMLKTHNNG